MLSMLQAHGLDAGPTQRPLLAGAAAGVLADIPALAVLVAFRSLDAPTQFTGTSPAIIALAFSGLLLIGGLIYGWLFQRAANDPRGGWLFGLSFGFVLWMVGPVPLLQWLRSRSCVAIPRQGCCWACSCGASLWGSPFPLSIGGSTPVWGTVAPALSGSDPMQPRLIPSPGEADSWSRVDGGASREGSSVPITETRYQTLPRDPA